MRFIECQQDGITDAYTRDVSKRFVTLLRSVANYVTSSLLSWQKCYDFNAANFRRHYK